MQRSPGLAGGAHGAWRVAAGTRQAGWLRGPRRHAGPDSTLPGKRALGTCGSVLCRDRGGARPHPTPEPSGGQASAAAGFRVQSCLWEMEAQALCRCWKQPGLRRVCDGHVADAQQASGTPGPQCPAGCLRSQTLRDTEGTTGGCGASEVHGRLSHGVWAHVSARRRLRRASRGRGVGPRPRPRAPRGSAPAVPVCAAPGALPPPRSLGHGGRRHRRTGGALRPAASSSRLGFPDFTERPGPGPSVSGVRELLGEGCCSSRGWALVTWARVKAPRSSCRPAQGARAQ